MMNEISENMGERIYNFVKTIESEEYREMLKKVTLVQKEQESLKNYFVKNNLVDIEVEIEKEESKSILSFECKFINRVDISSLPLDIREEYTKSTETYYKKTKFVSNTITEKPKLKIKLKV